MIEVPDIPEHFCTQDDIAEGPCTNGAIDQLFMCVRESFSAPPTISSPAKTSQLLTALSRPMRAAQWLVHRLIK